MIIAITGSFGSGKSSASKILKKFSKYEILDADKIAKKVYRKKTKEIKKAFGTANEKKISEIVFDDKKALGKLNSIIHPEVIKEIKCRLKTSENIILDVPLLIETELHKLADIVIVIKAKKRQQIKRLAERFSKEEIEKRLKYQLPDNEKIKHADYVIINDRNLRHLEKEVEEVWKKIKKK